MRKNYLSWAFYLSLAGTLFAGYMSSVKLLTNTCAFNEVCPYFLGYPACWFGFGMFFIMFIVASFGLGKKISEQAVSKALAIISFLGILFAGQYVIDEIPALIKQGYSTYALGLPTCTYGLIFYIIIFIISATNCCKKTDK